jgi:hypothetical protein
LILISFGKECKYEAPHRAVFSNLLPLHPSLFNIFSAPLIVLYILIFMLLDSK